MPGAPGARIGGNANLGVAIQRHGTGMTEHLFAAGATRNLRNGPELVDGADRHSSTNSRLGRMFMARPFPAGFGILGFWVQQAP
jgi:hypothetical protein